MPSTVYKGDLAEVAFAPETGMRIEKNVGTSSTIVSSSSGTVLTIDGTATNNAEPVQSGVLTYPLGMLVGSKISFFQAPTSSQIDAADVDGRTFTIIKHATAGTDGADGTVLTIHPAMATGNATFANNDGFEILPFCTYVLSAAWYFVISKPSLMNPKPTPFDVETISVIVAVKPIGSASEYTRIVSSTEKPMFL